MSDRDPVLAGDLYEHLVEPRNEGRLRRAMLLVGDALATALAGSVDLASGGDVVVRRRVDRVEVLRIPAGPPEEAAQVMAHVAQQLDTLTVADFHEAWSIGPSSS